MLGHGDFGPLVRVMTGAVPAAPEPNVVEEFSTNPSVVYEFHGGFPVARGKVFRSVVDRDSDRRRVQFAIVVPMATDCGDESRQRLGSVRVVDQHP